MSVCAIANQDQESVRRARPVDHRRRWITHCRRQQWTTQYERQCGVDAGQGARRIVRFDVNDGWTGPLWCIVFVIGHSADPRSTSQPETSSVALG